MSDTGIGITEQDHVSIFEVFSQVDASATRRYEGTGLGLAICRQLTELMGGTITVDSQLGMGSRFTVRLPLVRARSAAPHDNGHPFPQQSPETDVEHASPTAVDATSEARS